MTTKQPAYLHNKVAQGFGLCGAVVLFVASGLRFTTQIATAVDWVGLVAGAILSVYWLSVTVKGRRVRRQERVVLTHGS